MAVLRRWRETPGGLLLLTDSERRAERLAGIVHALDPASGVVVFPRWDRLPFDRAPPSPEVLGRRTSVLRRLAGAEAAPLVIATPDAVLQKVPPRRVWAGAAACLTVGEAVDLAAWQQRLGALGYTLLPDADEPGEAALQGQVLDLFPAGALAPVRIEVEDGRIAAIAFYDPATQRTTGTLETVVVDPITEVLGDGEEDAAEDGKEAAATCYEEQVLACYADPETIFDYLDDAQVVTDGAWRQRAEAWFGQIEMAQGGGPARGQSVSGRTGFYLECTAWDGWTTGKRAVAASSFLPPSEAAPAFALDRDPRGALRKFLHDQALEGRRVVLAAAHAADLRTMERVAASAKLEPKLVETGCAALAGDGPACASALIDFDRGFLLCDEAVAVVTAADLLGSRARHATPFDARRAVALEEAGLRFGDAVLHLDHGVGLLRGLETIATPEVGEQDVVRVEFAGGTDMLVPAGELGALWRYSGDAESVRLDKLNGDAWRKRRREIEADIEEAAKGLIEMAAERSGRHAPVLRPPPADYERFVARFPFTETPDQAAAVSEVLDDLASGKPMDRLVCGDVGFGKTEVALRAAAAALLAGKQVALVAPTTVLVRQHVETFARRFADLGLEVAQLSRLVKPAEARRVRDGLKSGAVRLVVGTHAVAAKGVAFADLGLVIIDEEQRFGTRDKAKVRGLTEACHLLVLTATPIPRTLMAARVGLQALSLLATPPARRVPVRTVTAPPGDETLRGAILDERRRGGQTFLVCPRIEDIPAFSQRLEALVPDAKVLVVHGQLPPEEVDDAMVRFAGGDGDVLLATNIIESGLDVPRANTILIAHPDRFGLAQLHQLRGRVGRGARRGKAFLLVDDGVAASARRRLDTFVRAEGIGAGFEISARDMDQRGAGDLLGEEQAGHVKLLGADLHRHLLERAIHNVRGETLAEEWTPDINIAAAARLPPDYVADAELRLNLYRRLAGLRSERAVAAFGEELDDRFGTPPAAVEALLDRAVLTQRCRDLGIMRVDVGPLGVALTFLTAAHRPEPPPEGAVWKGERLLFGKAENEPADVARVRAIVERLG